MAPQQDSRIAGDRRDRHQVAYPASLERRKDYAQRNQDMETRRQPDADVDDNEMYFGDS